MTLPQGYDYSCGLSAAATALDLYWDIPAEEAELIKEIEQEGNEELFYKVNLLDLSRILQARGIAAKAYCMDWEDLKDLEEKNFTPVIVHYNKPDKHFALLLGFINDQAVVADPARGLEILSKRIFSKRFSGAVLVMASREQARNQERLSAALNASRQKQKRMEETAVEDMRFFPCLGK